MEVFLSPCFLYFGLGRVEGEARQIDRVGTHICDESRLIETLGDNHRLCHRETKFARGFLLECRCGKRCGGRFTGRFYLYIFDGEVCVFTCFEQGDGLFFGFQPFVELGFHFDTFSVFGRNGKSGDNPIRGFTAELFYLFFPLYDEPHGYRLHPAGRESWFYFFPQHGREFKSHDTVEYSACLLCIYTVEVDRSRVFDGIEDCTFGNFVEDDTAGFFGVQSQYFVQVPCYGFSFAVFIGSEPYHIGFAGFFFQVFDKAFFVGRNFVYRSEVMVDIYTEIFLFQISDMTVTR